MEGGSQARWRRDGRELFYLAEDRTLMATTLTFNDVRVDAGTTERLFEARIPYLPYHGFDVAADGQRILMNTLVISPSTPSTVAANQSYVGADFSRPVISWP
jgi:hypothetical protein